MRGGERGGPAHRLPPLSYQHLQPYLRRPIHHIIMAFTSPLQMPVTFSYYQAEKRSIPTYFSSKTAFPRVSNKRKFRSFAEFGGGGDLWAPRPPIRPPARPEGGGGSGGICILTPSQTDTSLSLSLFFLFFNRFYFKSGVKAVARQPWELTFGYATV